MRQIHRGSVSLKSSHAMAALPSPRLAGALAAPTSRCSAHKLFPPRPSLRLRRAKRLSSRPSAVTESVRTCGAPLDGLILSPSSDPDAWDSSAVAGPVVLPPGSFDPALAPPGVSPSSWLMFYYGRASATHWGKGVPILNDLPFGSVGLAVSDDGIRWTKISGPAAGGAVLSPSDDDAAFDCAFVAASDVLPPSAALPSSDRWRLFYFAGGLSRGTVPGVPGSFQALPWLPGLATSADGLRFSRSPGPLLPVGPPGAWDHLSVSAPRVLPPAPAMSSADACADQWLLTYHAREDEELPPGAARPAGFYSVGVALSADGERWEKRGRVLSRGEPGAWDDGGVGTRHVVRFGGRYLMVYEACSAFFQFGLGLAVSDDGLQWERVVGVGGQPGGPVFAPRFGEEAAWDNFVVGTPYVVPREDGQHRLYYVGVGRREGQQGLTRGIGLAVCSGGDWGKWERVDAQLVE